MWHKGCYIGWLGGNPKQWIGSMLGGRKFTTTVRSDILESSVAKGCLQRGILLPQSCEAWLQRESYKDFGMALIHWVTSYPHQRKFPNSISKLLQEPLSMEKQGWGNPQISLYPQKVQHLNILWNKDTKMICVSRTLHFVQSAWMTTVPDLVFCCILFCSMSILKTLMKTS